MSRHLLSSVLCAAALLSASVLQATVVDFTWLGLGGNSNPTTTANWSGETAPTFSGGLENLIFPDQGTDFVGFTANSDLYGLNVTGHYHFSGGIFLHLYGGGLTHTSSYQTHLAFENSMAVDIAASQTWNLGSNSRVEFYSNAYITGIGQITKTGAGTLDPGSDNSGWLGGLQFNEGTIILRPDSYGTGVNESRSLGTGAVVIGPDTASRPTFEVYDWSSSGYSGDEVVLVNNFTLNGVFSSKNHEDLVLKGSVTLNADTTFRTAGDGTFIGGVIEESGGARKLTVDSTSALILYGASNWTGGTDVTKGALIFGGDTPNLPVGTSNILVGTNGYVGIGNDNSISSFMGKISTASTGTIGFDSDPEGMPDTFATEAHIDLSGFNPSIRLGSATSAILPSTVSITPYGTNYRFGGGGGWLQVGSELTSGRTVTLDSPSELPLTVRFTNTSNAFGSVSVTNSGAVFGTGALPTAASLTVANGAYLGSEDSAFSTDATAINNYLARFGATTPGIIGFDIDQFNEGAATRVIDLTGANMGSLTGGGYLGTASALFTAGEEGLEITGPGVRFTGTIAPNSDSVHRFAAYKGGALEVAGTLTGSAMIIGHSSSLGTFGDRNREEYSTVLISGDNENGLTGGTTFYGGRLMVGQATSDGVIGTDHTHALGEGTLTVASVSFTLEEEDGPETPSPLLSAYADNIIINNPIVVNAPELNLGGDSDFKLTGVISGPGELYVGEESDEGFVLTLSGANSYTGGTYVTNTALLKADSDSALGTGKLAFGSSAGRVEFSTTAPVIYGLESNTNSAKVWLNNANSARLRIIQNFDSSYMGELRADSGSTGTYGTFVKEGTGTLRLNDVDIYGYGQGGTNDIFEIQQGALVLADVWIESTTASFKINGGTLALDNNEVINNPVNVVSGALAGYGTFNSSVSIGTGAKLSPGLAGFGNVGTLTIDHLALNPGGIYDWHIRGAGTDGGRDLIKVGYEEPAQTLVINATSASPADKFTLKIISLDLANVEGGQLSGIDPGHGLYVWTLFEYDLLDTTLASDAFDPNAFNLDVSQFTTANGTGIAAGSFSLTLDAENKRILLNFTPVPEPSTYALMALGLGLIGLTVWRKRRA